jgi:hypothetical protein
MLEPFFLEQISISSRKWDRAAGLERFFCLEHGACLGKPAPIQDNPATRPAGEFGIVAQLWTGCHEDYDLQTITVCVL